MAQRVSALVYFDNGSQGFEEDYEPSINIKSYIKHFEDGTKRMNVTRSAVVEYIKITVMNEDGSFKLSDDGDREYEFIYQRSK